MPYFSVIIATYNRAHSIQKAIESILKQSFRDFEIIVVDDASTDNTQEVLLAIDDKRLICIRNEKNEERCVSRNKGINVSSGQYICFLDSDDYHLPEHLETIYERIKHFNKPKGFLFTNAWNETSDGVRSPRVCPDYDPTNGYSYFLKYTVNPQRWAVHKDVIKKHPFDPEVTICEDMDTSLRMLSAEIPIFHIKKTTTVYVAALDSFTMSDSKKAEKELFFLNKIFQREELKKRLNFWDKNRLKSMCYYHLAIKMFHSKSKYLTMKYCLQSFFLYPKGYNGATNKTLLIMYIYSIPFVQQIAKKILKK